MLAFFRLIRRIQVGKEKAICFLQVPSWINGMKNKEKIFEQKIKDQELEIETFRTIAWEILHFKYLGKKNAQP